MKNRISPWRTGGYSYIEFESPKKNILQFLFENNHRYFLSRIWSSKTSDYRSGSRLNEYWFVSSVFLIHLRDTLSYLGITVPVPTCRWLCGLVFSASAQSCPSVPTPAVPRQIPRPCYCQGEFISFSLFCCQRAYSIVCSFVLLLICVNASVNNIVLVAIFVYFSFFLLPGFMFVHMCYQCVVEQYWLEVFSGFKSREGILTNLGTIFR